MTRRGRMGALNRRDFIKTASVSAALRSIGIFRSSGDFGVGGHQDISTELLSIVEGPARPNEVVAYPETGTVMAVNPPGFCWPPHEEARSYRLEVRDAAGVEIFRTPALESTVWPPARSLEPEDYTWRVVYLDSSGRPYGQSKERRFNISAKAPQLVMPEIGRLKVRLADVRPRLFLVGDQVQQIQQGIKNGTIRSFPSFIQAANAAVSEKSYPEPRRPDRPWTLGEIGEWRPIIEPAKIGSAHLARTALAYRISGEPEYLAAAKRWLMSLVGWHPKGITSYDVLQPDGMEGIDEAAMPILERVSLAWDWIGGELSSDERSEVVAVIKERGTQILRILQKEDFPTHPFVNHEGRVLSFLGLAGLSFLNDIPEAEEWLEYVLRCYLTSYPSWGGDDGGWAQGMSYWSSYVYWLTNFAESLRRVTDIDLYRRPFYRHTGYFPVYFQPPYAPRGAFGDGGDHGPSELDRVLLDRLAEAFEDRILKWHAQSIGQLKLTEVSDPWHQWYIDDVLSVASYSQKTSMIAPRPPTDLPTSQLLPDIGWVAMHSALGEPQNDAWALFKSSRFGSFSHNHGDQNTFQLNAYGRALAIDSGYYPWYDSPHDNLWTRQTRAHNGILVNGRGQATHTWEAQGRIESFENHGILTLARGQAADAYNVPQPGDVLRQWREHLKEPIPSMLPIVKTFDRTLAFLASKTRPLLIVYDSLKTDGATTFSWLLHALNQMQTDDGAGTIRLHDGDARLIVCLRSSKPLRFSQQNAFSVPPERPENTAYQEVSAQFPNQWHLAADTHDPTNEVKFLAVMVPYRYSEDEPKIKAFESGQTAGFEVGDSRVAAWWGEGDAGQIQAEGLTGKGRMVILFKENGMRQRVVCR
jgi:hypothetical protein